jgi:hypothetical protein
MHFRTILVPGFLATTALAYNNPLQRIDSLTVITTAAAVVAAAVVPQAAAVPTPSDAEAEKRGFLDDLDEFLQSDCDPNLGCDPNIGI